MKRLIIVSNRLPLSINLKGHEINLQPSVGGLATGLRSFYRDYDSVWVGWPGIVSEKIKDKKEPINEILISEKCVPVFLTQKQIDLYYNGFSNKTIWPLFHYFQQYTVYQKQTFESYKRVNQIFADTVSQIAKDDDLIWIHDFQLMLLPEMLRKILPNAKIGYFHHIPFPSSEIFRLLPWREELLSGLLGADLIGFHTYDYTRHFLESVRRLLGFEHTFGQISTKDRIIKTDVYPMGIDYEHYSEAIHLPEVKKEIKKIKQQVSKRQIILSIDRLDFTKGITQRLISYAYFLEKNPKFREKVTLILVVVPSRGKVDLYQRLKKEVEEQVGQINGSYGTLGWNPIWYLYRSIPFSNLIALYNQADVALVTPSRDGMNLIAKEYLATKEDNNGVLILSELAGAAKELGEALIINPNDKEQIASAIYTALTMPIDKKKQNIQVMKSRLKRYNVTRWAREFMGDLENASSLVQGFHTKRITSDIRNAIFRSYQKSQKRLILLDYDGTLREFVSKPEDALPDRSILDILKNLSSDPKNQVVIVSGRDKDTLSKWFGHLDVDIAAEHGAWIKIKPNHWQLIDNLNDEWKKEFLGLFEIYCDRTPGSFIEEKSFSLCWHFRKSDPEQGKIRAQELKEELVNLSRNLELSVLEGNKVIEIKNSLVSKGHAAQKWLNQKDWDFILSIGDDWTDEDMFAILPKWSYTIRVGLCLTKARYVVESHVESVKKFLKILGGMENASY